MPNDEIKLSLNGDVLKKETNSYTSQNNLTIKEAQQLINDNGVNQAITILTMVVVCSGITIIYVSLRKFLNSLLQEKEIEKKEARELRELKRKDRLEEMAYNRERDEKRHLEIIEITKDSINFNAETKIALKDNRKNGERILDKIEELQDSLNDNIKVINETKYVVDLIRSTLENK